MLKNKNAPYPKNASKYAPNPQKRLISEKFRIGNHLIIILHLGFKFQVRKSKNIEDA